MFPQIFWEVLLMKRIAAVLCFVLLTALVPAAAFKGQALIFAFTLLLPLFASQLPLEWEKGRWPLLLIALATPLTMFFLGQGEASFLYHGHGSLLGLVLLLGVVAWRERPSVAALASGRPARSVRQLIASRQTPLQ